MLKNNFLKFPSVMWLHQRDEVDKSVKYLCHFFQDLTTKNYKNRLISDEVIQKIKRWTLGGGIGYILKLIHQAAPVESDIYDILFNVVAIWQWKR